MIFLGLLKTKANVSIDPDYGRNMLGVLDETGILNYGEIFVQYSTDISCGETMRETKILEGKCVVILYLYQHSLAPSCIHWS